MLATTFSLDGFSSTGRLVPREGCYPSHLPPWPLYGLQYVEVKHQGRHDLDVFISGCSAASSGRMWCARALLRLAAPSHVWGGYRKHRLRSWPGQHTAGETRDLSIALSSNTSQTVSTATSSFSTRPSILQDSARSKLPQPTPSSRRRYLGHDAREPRTPIWFGFSHRNDACPVSRHNDRVSICQ